MLKIVGWSSLVAAALLLSAIAYRAQAQQRRASNSAINTPSGIQQEGYVDIGGVPQWIQIRGEDIKNPVLLIIHGGPGMSYVPFTPYFRAWEKHFTVVQWDRRGVAKTYARNGAADSATLTFSRMVTDGVLLAEILKRRLKADKLVLLGHSIGSLIAVRMAHERPDLFSAYIGTDQRVDMKRNEQLSYEMLLGRAKTSGDAKLLRAVEAVGPPPYATATAWFEKQRLASSTDRLSGNFENELFKLIPSTPSYTMKDMMAFGTGLKYSAATLLPEMMTLDLNTLGRQFRVPIIIIQGEDDVIAPTVLAKDWFQNLEAPRKRFITLRGAGHNSMFVRSDDFLRALVQNYAH